MIGKLTKGKNFYPLVFYILDPNKNAELIDSQGVLIKSHQDIVSSFNIQAELNQRLGLKVGHISLNFHKNDLSCLTNKMLIKIAREYLNEMGINNTQYIIGRHFDKEHPHIHICYNRVDNDGKTISDKNEKIRNAKITNALTLKYGLYYSSGKEHIKAHRLREPYKTKQEIYEVVSVTFKSCDSWEDLRMQLEHHGVEISVKCRGQTSDILGVLFIKNGYTFSGSKIDRSLSYYRIDETLKSNILSQSIIKRNDQHLECKSFLTPYNQYYSDYEEDKIQSTKKKNKRKSNNKGLSL